MPKTNYKGPKKENVRPQHGYRLAYMIQNLPHNQVQNVVNMLDEYSKTAPQKVSPLTGDSEKELQVFSSMGTYFGVLDKVYSICLKDKKIKESFKSDTFTLDSCLFLKIAQGIASYLKMKPENQDKTDDEIDEMILDSFYKAYTEGKI